MAVALDNSDKLSGVPFAAGPFTLSYVTTGANLVMIVTVGWDAKASNISAITYDGVSLGTPLWDLTTTTVDERSAGFLLIAPHTGTNTFSITFDASVVEYGIGISTWTGVNQSTPNRTVSTATDDAFNLNVSVTTANAVAGDIVVDGAWGLQAPMTRNGAQTALQLSDNIGGNNRSMGSSYKAASGSSDVMQWTLTSGGVWITGAIPLIAAAAPLATLSLPTIPTYQQILVGLPR